MPVQYVFGHTAWRNLDLEVTPATLIPRPETAQLVDVVEQQLGESDALQSLAAETASPTILDLGTGSGCIALALKKDNPSFRITGVDCSAEALRVAERNGRRNNLDVTWLQADILSDTLPPCDVIVSNPPYVLPSEKKEMEDNVLLYEPSTALFVPEDTPLQFYLPTIKRHARWLFFEVNPHFAHILALAMQEEGYTNILITKDMYGKERILSGTIAV